MTGVFSHRTLNDNWLEDRCQPPGALCATAGFENRVPRKTETDIAYIGERYDVLGRISRLPSKTSFATPDDGFRETLSTNLADLKNPKSHPMLSSKKITAPPMINTANAPVCLPEQRPLDGPASGFGAPISRHDNKHDQRGWTTTHGDVYGYGDSKMHRSFRSCPSILRPSGTTSEDAENRGTGMKCGQLCGESFRDLGDPAMDTRTQRAWLPGGDASLRNIHLGGSRAKLPRADNELSLPLGDGAMSKVRQDLKERSGRLCRVATNITKGAHQKSGVSLFHDD